MSRFLGLVVLLFLGGTAFVYFFGAPETAGHGVDTDKAIDSAGKTAEVVGDVAGPWYDVLSAQAWFGTAVFALAGCIILNRIWRGMNATAKIGVAVMFAVIAVMIAVGLNK